MIADHGCVRDESAEEGGLAARLATCGILDRLTPSRADYKSTLLRRFAGPIAESSVSVRVLVLFTVRYGKGKGVAEGERFLGLFTDHAGAEQTGHPFAMGGD